MRIIVYTKTRCPWSAQVMEYLRRNNLPFEERNMTEHPEFQKEVEEKTGQSKSATLDIDGVMLPNVGVEEVAETLAKMRQVKNAT
ncbi:MAG: glutaredoxin [bacterium]|nr:glutaredoxin [bacterium]